MFQELCLFGMGIHISQETKTHASTALYPLTISLMLINDYYSWPKELQAHLQLERSGYPANAVPILMHQHGLCEASALELLKIKIIDFQAQHLAEIEKLEQKGPLSPDMRIYFNALQLVTSGTEFWSMHASRYPSKTCLNQPPFVLPLPKKTAESMSDISSRRSSIRKEKLSPSNSLDGSLQYPDKDEPQPPKTAGKLLRKITSKLLGGCFTLS